MADTEKVTCRIGGYTFVVGPEEPPAPPPDTPLCQEFKRRLAAGETMYGFWHNADTFGGFPAYDVLRFGPDGHVFRAESIRDDFSYTGKWVEECYSPIVIAESDFGRMTRVVEEADLEATLAVCRYENRQWYGME